MKRFFVFLPIFLLAAGCIQVRPRTQDHAPDAAPPIKENGLAAPEDPLRTDILNRIAKQKIRWDDLSRYPAPEQLWREARFRQVRPDGRLKPGDFLFEKLVRLQGRQWKISFIFLPLRVAYDGRRIWETRVDFTWDDENGEVSEIRMSSELKELSLPGILRLSASDCNAISAAVLKTLFALQLPDGVRAKEKFRFCFPVNGADEKFRDHLHPRARIPELPPDEEYPGLPVPFEKGRYRSFAQGAFYYYAGITLPVTDKEVWVFDTAVRYAGGQTSGTYYKLKKGLFFWEIVTEGSYDAPSRAVRERESP